VLLASAHRLLKLVNASLQIEPEPAYRTDQPPPPHRKRATSPLDASQYTNYQEEFVPQWPSDSNSVNHTRRKGQCGTNS
jgi:hypothetical protein